MDGIRWTGAGALEGCTARYRGTVVTAWGVVGAPRGAPPEGTSWVASDAECRRVDLERIELGPRVVESRWNA